MNDLQLPEILDGLQDLPNNWLEQISDMCDFIITERIEKANEEDEA